jgi:predicted DNA-binding protein (UPF0251 family)
MAKTQNPATIIAQACAALAQVSQQLSAAVQMMNGEQETAETPKRRGRPPAAAKAEEKKPVKFTAAEIEKIRFLIDTGTEKQEAMRKVFNLRGGSKAPAAKPTVKVAPKKKAIRMITREDVENDSYTLAEFRAHLKENGIEKGTDDYASLNAKFLELRKKFKEEIEEENSVEEPEMTDDEQLMGEFTTEGDDGGFDFSE